jgi:hypothetical protein
LIAATPPLFFLCHVNLQTTLVIIIEVASVYISAISVNARPNRKLYANRALLGYVLFCSVFRKNTAICCALSSVIRSNKNSLKLLPLAKQRFQWLSFFITKAHLLLSSVDFFFNFPSPGSAVGVRLNGLLLARYLTSKQQVGQQQKGGRRRGQKKG